MASLTDPSDPSPQSLRTGSASASAAVGRSSQRSDLDPQTQVAVDYLQQVCARAQGVDKDRSFYLSQLAYHNFASDDEVPQPDSFGFGDAGKDNNGYRHANIAIKDQLEKLKGLALFPRDRQELDGIFDHMHDQEGTIKDLQQLGKLLGEVTQANYEKKLDLEVKLARADLKAIARKYKGEPSQREVTLKPRLTRKGHIERSIQFTKRNSPKEGRNVGETLAEYFSLLRANIAKTQAFDDGATLRDFDNIIDDLKRGDVRTRQFVKLEKAVARGENPDKRAREAVSLMFQGVGPYHVEKSTLAAEDLALQNRFDPHQWDFEARDIVGLDPILPESSDKVVKEDLALIRKTIKNNREKRAHIRYLHGLIEQEKNPAAFALNELSRVNEMAERMIFDTPITWRDGDMDFKTTWFSTEKGRKQAGERLYARLEPLAKLCDPHNASQQARVNELLQKIKAGNGASNDIKELNQIFDELGNHAEKKRVYEGRNPNDKRMLPPSVSDRVRASSQERETELASQWFDTWAELEAPHIGRHVVDLLSVLRVQVRDFNPSQFKLFCDQIGRIRKEGETDRQTVRTLKEILTEARRAEKEAPLGTKHRGAITGSCLLRWRILLDR